MDAFDRLGRRRRMQPFSTGKRVSLQVADLIWLEKLHEHGPLPSSFLLAFTRHLRRSDKRAIERLTDLFNEEATKHGGRYLDRPPQQFRTIDSRYNQLVYDLTLAGQRALAEHHAPVAGLNANGPWLHRFMVACTTASIELGTRDRDDLSYVPGHRILERAKTQLRRSIEIEDEEGRRLSQYLIPDGLFGLAYHTPDGDRFRFFVVECDRATEPVTTSDWNRKSWLRSLTQYQAYIAEGRYRDHLKLTAPLLLLNVCSSAARMDKLRAATTERLGPTSYQLFRSWSDFAPVFRPPRPKMDLLNAAWQRAGPKPFRIDQP